MEHIFGTQTEMKPSHDVEGYVQGEKNAKDVCSRWKSVAISDNSSCLNRSCEGSRVVYDEVAGTSYMSHGNHMGKPRRILL